MLKKIILPIFITGLIVILSSCSKISTTYTEPNSNFSNNSPYEQELEYIFQDNLSINGVRDAELLNYLVDTFKKSYVEYSIVQLSWDSNKGYEIIGKHGERTLRVTVNPDGKWSAAEIESKLKTVKVDKEILNLIALSKIAEIVESKLPEMEIISLDLNQEIDGYKDIIYWNIVSNQGTYVNYIKINAVTGDIDNISQKDDKEKTT